MTKTLLKTVAIGIGGVALLAGAANAQGKGKNKDKSAKPDHAIDQVDDTSHPKKDKSLRGNPNSENDGDRGNRPAHAGADHDDDGQDRSSEHRRDGEHRQDGHRGMNGQDDGHERTSPMPQEEAVSQGKSAKNPEDAKGKGKKRGWWGRLFGRD